MEKRLFLKGMGCASILSIIPILGIAAKSMDIEGRAPSSNADRTIADDIIDGLPKDNPYHVMLELSKITYQNESGENYNERWIHFANPLIRRMFSDIGYNLPVKAGDCTPWCAATLTWCLQRCNIQTPKADIAVSALGYIDYGKSVSTPRLGDIALFAHTNDSGHGHIGFYDSTYGEQTKTTVPVLGANQANIKAIPTQCGIDYPNNKITLNHISKNGDDENSNLKFLKYISYS